MFSGRKLIIATMHGKERVIAPFLEHALDVKCTLANTLNTDQFGTFTGEIKRDNDPIETARQKCLKAMELSDCDLAVASEGSFGPHPTIGFVNADDEILLFMDQKNELEIIARELSLDTNFDSEKIENEGQLLKFADKVKFPSHALILKAEKGEKSEIIKGIVDVKILTNTFADLSGRFESIFVETDMRAMFNPTRMRVIKRATVKLLEKIRNTCPVCKTPGFSVSEVVKGLACSNCSFPTRSTLAYVLTCVKCQHAQWIDYPHGKLSEEPTFCDLCNP